MVMTTLTELAIEKGIEPEKAREFLREWFGMQEIKGYVDKDNDIWYSKKLAGRYAIPLIARPNMEDL